MAGVPSETTAPRGDGRAASPAWVFRNTLSRRAIDNSDATDRGPRARSHRLARTGVAKSHRGLVGIQNICAQDEPAVHVEDRLQFGAALLQPGRQP